MNIGCQVIDAKYHTKTLTKPKGVIMKYAFSRNLKAYRQSGYSLVELSVALAIVAVILVGALMGTRQVLLSNGINSQVRDSATVISKIQRQYAKQANTANVSTSVLGPLGIWPVERTSASNGVWSVRGVLSGSSEFVFSNATAIGSLPVNGGFIYTLRQVPTEACGELASALDSVAFAMYVGPSAAAAPADGSTPTSTVVKPADSSAINMSSLATACAPGGTNGVDMAIVFRL